MEEDVKTNAETDPAENKMSDLRLYSPLVLAYIGDAVYEVHIRKHLLQAGNQPVEKLHKAATRFVKASAQAAAAEYLHPQWTEEEQDIYRRGRNAKSGSVAKSGTVAEYRVATGFEALMGYLYLSGNIDRILELVERGIKAVDI